MYILLVFLFQIYAAYAIIFQVINYLTQLIVFLFVILIVLQMDLSLELQEQNIVTKKYFEYSHFTSSKMFGVFVFIIYMHVRKDVEAFFNKRQPIQCVCSIFILNKETITIKHNCNFKIN